MLISGFGCYFQDDLPILTPFDPNLDPRDPDKGLKTKFYQKLILPSNFSYQKPSLS